MAAAKAVHMKLMCLLLSAAVLMAAARLSAAQTGAADTGSPATPVPIGRWTARFQHGGLFLDFDGVPLIKGGIVQLFGANSRRGYFGSGSNPPVGVVEALPAGGRAYISEYHYSAGGVAFHAVQRVEVRPDNTVRMSIRSHWVGAEPALLEWNPARLWAYPLLGARFEAKPLTNTPDSPAAHGTVPLRPRSANAIENNVSHGWSQLTLRLPALGDLTIINETDDTTGSSPALLDGRGDPNLRNDRLFWLGLTGARLEPGQEKVHSLSLTLFPRGAIPPPPNGTGLAEASHAAVRTIPDALLPAAPLMDSAGRPVIVPQPKRASFTEGHFALRGRVPLAFALPASDAGRRAERAARQFAAEIGRRTGVAWLDLPINAGPSWNRGGLIVTTLDAAPPGLRLPAPPPEPEGYVLVVTPQFVAVVGRDAAGAFYGLQTLRQLLRTGGVDGAAVARAGSRAPGPRFLGANITDWPSLRMRAAHLFVGKDALPFHRKLIDRIFSRYKLNTLVLECEYTRWRSHPEIWQSYSMDPDDLRKEVDHARERFMEPIPLVNSLGHSEWIFKNGQHLELAEDVKSPHAYDVSNPDSYKFIFNIFGEAIDIFRPRYFHIGHDEIKILGSDLFGRYPARPQNIEKGLTTLFMEDTNRLADWLRAKGIVPMLWGDMLLHASEGGPSRSPEMSAANAPSVEAAVKRRSLLPKDAVIADWRYEPGSEQRNGLEIFKAAGHEALGSAWFSPENIRGWAHEAIATRAMGTMQTTWAGYDSKEALLDEEYRQFTAFILAAEYAWSGTALHPRAESPRASTSENDLLPYHAADLFARAYRDDPAPSARRPGWILDLTQAANVVLADSTDPAGFVTPLSPTAQSSQRKAEEQSNTRRSAKPGANFDFRTSGIRFRLDRTRTAGIMLRGLLQPDGSYLERDSRITVPPAASLPIGSSARELAFVHATLNGVEAGAHVASYVVHYTGGQSATILLRYGREIRALDDGDGDSSFSSERLFMPRSAVSPHLFRWTNPHPELSIVSIEFRAESPLASPILFAVTGLK